MSSQHFAGEFPGLTAVLDAIIRQNENTLEQLDQYRVCVENIHKSRKGKQEEGDKTLHFSVAERKPRLRGRLVLLLLHYN